MNGSFKSLERGRRKMERPVFLASPYSDDLGQGLRQDARRSSVAPWFKSGETYGADAAETASTVVTAASSLFATFAPLFGKKKRTAAAEAEYSQQMAIAQAQAEAAATTQRTMMVGFGGLALVFAIYGIYKVTKK